MAYRPYGQITDNAMSKFNSAQLQIIRLNNCWSNCIDKWRKGDFKSLNWELDAIWPEFWADTKPEEKEFYEKINSDIAEETKPTKYAELVREKWLFLKEVEKNQGLGKSYYDPSKAEFD